MSDEEVIEVLALIAKEHWYALNPPIRGKWVEIVDDLLKIDSTNSTEHPVKDGTLLGSDLLSKLGGPLRFTTLTTGSPGEPMQKFGLLFRVPLAHES